MIERYEKDGEYINKHGVAFDSAVSFVQESILGFCGCSQPLKNLYLIRDGLRHIDSPPPVSADHAMWFEKWLCRGIGIFGSADARQFFFYWCDKEGYTNHGTGLPGWLTPKGRTLLELIEDAIQRGEAEKKHHG